MLGPKKSAFSLRICGEFLQAVNEVGASMRMGCEWGEEPKIFYGDLTKNNWDDHIEMGVQHGSIIYNLYYFIWYVGVSGFSFKHKRNFVVKLSGQIPQKNGGSLVGIPIIYSWLGGWGLVKIVYWFVNRWTAEFPGQWEYDLCCPQHATSTATVTFPFHCLLVGRKICSNCCSQRFFPSEYRDFAVVPDVMITPIYVAINEYQMSIKCSKE